MFITQSRMHEWLLCTDPPDNVSQALACIVVSLLIVSGLVSEENNMLAEQS